MINLATFFMFTPEYATVLKWLLLGFGIFVILVFFIIPRFFPALQYKIEEFRNRNNGDEDEE